jgi:galacturonosyltransferase
MREKGVYELLGAFEQLEKTYNNIKLDMYGFCEEDNTEFLDKVSSLSNVEYHGFTDDSAKEIRNSHALILPSYHEGLSNVLLEASAMGRPILASDIPGCVEVLDDGVTGFIFESKNVVSLIGAVSSFIGLSYDDKKQFGVNARTKVEKEFDRNIVVSKYLEQIKDL